MIHFIWFSISFPIFILLLCFVKYSFLPRFYILLRVCRLQVIFFPDAQEEKNTVLFYVYSVFFLLLSTNFPFSHSFLWLLSFIRVDTLWLDERQTAMEIFCYHCFSTQRFSLVNLEWPLTYFFILFTRHIKCCTSRILYAKERL